jgi:hypothetical protein
VNTKPTKSRAEREGRYAGTADGKPVRDRYKDRLRSISSMTSDYYMPNRKAFKRVKMEAINSMPNRTKLGGK